VIAGAAMTVSGAEATEQVPEPSRVPGMNGSDPVPGEDAREAQNPDLLNPPATDSGTLPDLRFSFADAHVRQSSGGWTRQVTARELGSSKSDCGSSASLSISGASNMESIYRGVSRQELDIAYNNVLADPDYAARTLKHKERSEAIYRSATIQRNKAYGPLPRQRFDWFSGGSESAPTFVFIHGGYWQNYRKEDLAFVASGALEHGFNVALAEYTLAPEASMTEIVHEIRGLLDHLRSARDEIRFGAGGVCLCGHSAGGQLAALRGDHPTVALVVSVSALFDLEPISLCWLNDKLRLTQEEVLKFSPISNIRAGAPALVTVGGAELPELVRQSQDYSAARAMAGKRTSMLTIPARTHFSILDDLADPAGKQMSAIVAAMSSV
jgi:arylformamidase